MALLRLRRTNANLANKWDAHFESTIQVKSFGESANLE
jgi:hypothetical protein